MNNDFMKKLKAFEQDSITELSKIKGGHLVSRTYAVDATVEITCTPKGSNPSDPDTE